MDEATHMPDLYVRAKQFFSGRDLTEPWSFVTEAAAMYEAGKDEPIRLFLANKHYVDHHPDTNDEVFSPSLLAEALGDEVMDWYGYLGVAQAVSMTESQMIRPDEVPQWAGGFLKFNLGAVVVNRMALTGECLLWRTHVVPTQGDRDE